MTSAKSSPFDSLGGRSRSVRYKKNNVRKSNCATCFSFYGNFPGKRKARRYYETCRRSGCGNCRGLGFAYKGKAKCHLKSNESKCRPGLQT